MKEQEQFRKTVKAIHRSLTAVFGVVVLVSGVLVFMMIDPDFSSFRSEDLTAYEVVEEVDEDLIVDGIHMRTGLVEAEGLMEVVNNCTSCHSAKIVIQNRMNEERWAATIDWMQETQNLWDLGKNEQVIIDYLVKNYPPKKIGRRQILTGVEWYELDP
jgi:hypothetical protein